MIPLPQPTKITESSETKGVFVVDNLYPGYGITIGNSLRRVLLSSLEGAAITQVTIKGANHEFATLPGVLEDVITILLNLKQVRFRMHGDEAQKATLKIKGEKEIKASDFELPATLELVSKDLKIATLTEKTAELEMEIIVERGVGYVPAEDRNKEKQGIGVIALDAIFTPLRRVSSRVENMRVGDRTDFNRLTLEIETDGTITPEEAFDQAVKLLLEQFAVVESGVEGAAPKNTEKETAKPKKEKKATAKKTTKTKKG